MVESQRREITLYAWDPADAVDYVMDHGGAEGSGVLGNIPCGPATVTVESVARLSLNGPSTDNTRHLKQYPGYARHRRLSPRRDSEAPAGRSSLIGFHQY